MVSAARDLTRERHWTCARRLSERRHDLGLTQSEVVDRLTELGVTASNRTLSAMEHGQGVDVCRLPEIAVALDCTVTYLLGLTEDPTRWSPDDLPCATPADSAAPPRTSSGHGSWILGPVAPEFGQSMPSEPPRA